MIKPFFSVVLPTYNRASYLPLAIKSALNQTFTDFELIISNNFSTDETEEVIKEFDDNRIKYVKTTQNFNMNEHWEFALNHAKGEFVTFLGDDDAHSPIYLETFYKAIEETNTKLIVCKIGHYYFQEFRGYGMTIAVNSFMSGDFTGNTTVIDSNKVINGIFSNLDYPPEFSIPQLSNTAYHHSIFASIKNRMQGVFPSTVLGDIYTSITTNNSVDSMVFVDKPLFVHGFSRDSVTSIDSKEKKKEFRKMFPTDFTKTDIPLKISGLSWFPTLIKAKEDLSPDLDNIKIDWGNYFMKSYEHLLAEEVLGNNVQEEKEEFFSVLEKQDKELQEKILQKFNNPKAKVSQWLRRNLGSKNFTNLLRKAIGKNSRHIIIEGKGNFDDIFECASFIDKDFISTYKTQKDSQ
jgi:glycosyltransferase involved in cell wall biosynthesis